jgi:hypothetical protein
VSAAQRSRIFISDRRDDSEHAALRLAADLRDEFSPQDVFLDLASIYPGADFVLALQQALADCAAVLVVIGPRWLAVTDAEGRRRLDAPDAACGRRSRRACGAPGSTCCPYCLTSPCPLLRACPRTSGPSRGGKPSLDETPLVQRHRAPCRGAQSVAGAEASPKAARHERAREGVATGWLRADLRCVGDSPSQRSSLSSA